MHSFIQRIQRGANTTLQCGRYPAHCLQWTSRHLLLWLLIAFAVIGVPTLYYAGSMDIETVNKLGRFLCFAIVALSLDLIWGYGGMLCLCQFLFFALGGYAMGMYLAHHGGPEGIIGANGWGKVPACLYVVYPYQSGEVPADAVVPWFWKPFWTLPTTVLLGLLIPGVVAGLIGYTVFRSRVRGVFFAVLTQALVLGFWLVFSMNSIYLCGTNGLTRFDHIILGSREKIEVVVDSTKLADHTLTDGNVEQALKSWCDDKPGATIFGSKPHFVVAIDKSFHVWNERTAIGRLPVTEGSEVTIADVANISISGFKLTDANVKLSLYIITVISLIGIYFFCRMLIRSRIGRVLVAIRDNESRLRFSGYEPYAFKAMFFAMSAAIAGLAGMLYAPQMRIFTPTNLEPKESILVVVWVAIGGRGSLSGAILGALAISYGYDYLTSNSPDAWPFVLGALVVAVTRLPQGLIGIWNKWLDFPILPSEGYKPHASVTTTTSGNLTASESWWNKGLIGFGIASVTFGAFLAFECVRYGGPFGSGLMKTGTSTHVVIGFILVCMSLCSLIQIPAGVGMALRKRWAFTISRKAFTGLLTLLAGLIFWSFFINSFRDGINGWLFAGLSGSFEFAKAFPLTIAALVWASAGLAIAYFAPKPLWAGAGEFESWNDLETEETLPAPSTMHDITSTSNKPKTPRQIVASSNGHLLRVKDLKVLFGGFKALDIDDFSVKPNELNVVIGPNGAGKTTLCDVISGKTRATEGSVRFAGRNITEMSDVQIARLGVGRKFQTPTVFDSLTVYENMELALPGRESLLHNLGHQPSAEENLRILGVLERVGLVDRVTKKVAYLSHGQRQWLEISMLILASPKLLLVDEPAAGLTDQETRLTADLLLELKDEHSIIVIEHDMEFVRRLDSPVTVLIDGKIEDHGTMQEIQNNRTVREAYLGR